MRSGELDLPSSLSIRAVQRDADFFLIPLPGKDNQRQKGEVIGYAMLYTRIYSLFVSPGGMPAIQGILPKLGPFIDQAKSSTYINSREVRLADYFTESFANADYQFVFFRSWMSASLAILEILASAGFEVAGVTMAKDDNPETLLVLRSK